MVQPGSATVTTASALTSAPGPPAVTVTGSSVPGAASGASSSGTSTSPVPVASPRTPAPWTVIGAGGPSMVTRRIWRGASTVPTNRSVHSTAVMVTGTGRVLSDDQSNG